MDRIDPNFSVSYKHYLQEVQNAEKERRQPKITISSQDIIQDCERAIEIFLLHYSSFSLAERTTFYRTLKGFNSSILSNGDFSYFRSKTFSEEDNAQISELAPSIKSIIDKIHEERQILRSKQGLKSRTTSSPHNAKPSAKPFPPSDERSDD